MARISNAKKRSERNHSCTPPACGPNTFLPPLQGRHTAGAHVPAKQPAPEATKCANIAAIGAIRTTALVAIGALARHGFAHGSVPMPIAAALALLRSLLNRTAKLPSTCEGPAKLRTTFEQNC